LDSLLEWLQIYYSKKPIISFLSSQDVFIDNEHIDHIQEGIIASLINRQSNFGITASLYSKSKFLAVDNKNNIFETNKYIN